MSSSAVGFDADWSEQALRALLEEWDGVRLRVRGNCMAPQLREGEVVTLQAARRLRPRWGDIVLVRTPAGLRLHRIVWRSARGQAWRTKGDQAPFWDAAVGSDQILAVAPKTRQPATALRSLLRAVIAGSFTRLARAVCP